VLSGGEKTRLALATLVCSGANVLLLDEPTNNLDPVSREQVLDAIARYPGAIVLVTHDPGAVTALKPDRAILLPDGVEDAWSDDLLELVELACAPRSAVPAENGAPVVALRVVALRVVALRVVALRNWCASE
jgi:energy-coupling factor transporter ATP-binding protein EcfA2